jgi:4-hydroxy-3-polyprenylbenzoate decarboxylase
MSFILGITGASGAIYSIRLLEVLLHAGYEVHLSISESGRAVLKQELDIDVDLQRFEPASLTTPADPNSTGGNLLKEICGPIPPHLLAEAGRLHYHHYRDFMAPIASGSFLSGGMVICPCSGTTLSAVAHAAAGNLIQRAAEVQLKEGRKLIVVPRETPLSSLQLENMHRLSQAGVVMLPASPGWYHGVRSLADLVDFVVARICDQLEVEHNLMRRWGSE